MSGEQIETRTHGNANALRYIERTTANAVFPQSDARERPENEIRTSSLISKAAR
ncbi:hypothetical protein FHS27_004943 [Rhodopirellula rubra]|uniref:Uncharacterized protein n=1 Tax=Aporhodopirellula rubra TaxID=980271 RepID=A0A7W5H701_9BACT|nr:hypothetical protein [Aporhodopirellula rubra]